jgi:signal peptidase I
MRFLPRSLHDRRQQKKRFKQLELVAKRARRRGHQGRTGYEDLTRTMGELKAAIRARDEGKAGRLEQDAERLIEKHMPECIKATLMESILSLFWAVLFALAIRAFIVEPFQIPTGSMIPTLQIGDHIFVNKLAYGFRIPLLNWHLIGWAEPQRGDIVIFPFPKEGPDYGKDYIKRIVAVPGDRIRLKDNVLHLNGEPVESQALKDGVPTMDSMPAWARCDTQVERLGSNAFISQHHAEATCRRRGQCLSSWPLERRPSCLALSQDDCPPYFGDKASNEHWPDVLIPEGHYLMIGDNRDNSSDGRFWGLVPRENILGKAMFIWLAKDKSRIFGSIH